MAIIITGGGGPKPPEKPDLGAILMGILTLFLVAAGIGSCTPH